MLGLSLQQQWTELALFFIIAAAVVIGVALAKLKQQVDTLADKTGDLTKAVGTLQESVHGLESTISDGAAE